MFEIVQLEQLLAIKKYGTLSAAAEHLNISQPALSRSIQRLEEELEVSLFIRQRNKMEFNEEGELALQFAENILNQAHEMKSSIIASVTSRQSIHIGSIAPYPMWSLTSEIQKVYPAMSVHAEMRDADRLEEGLQSDEYQVIITNHPEASDDVVCIDYCEEDLYVTLPPAHPLASRKEIALRDLRGQSMLTYKDIGFWNDVLMEKIPDAKLIYQDSIDALDELRKASALPAFVTNLTGSVPKEDHRVTVPIEDDEANVIFYLKYKKSNKKLFENISLSL